MKQLLLGAGVNHKVRGEVHGELTTLDYNPDRRPDIVWDLTQYPWPLETGAFDEIHCYHVIEHLWQQGDYKAFFQFFSECARVLVPQGTVLVIFPNPNHYWAIGDPSHKCIIHPIQFQFLCQEFYRIECDQNRGMGSDFRSIYKDDFKIEKIEQQPQYFEIEVLLRKVG